MGAYFGVDRKTGKWVRKGMTRGEYYKKYPERYGGLPNWAKDVKSKVRQAIDKRAEAKGQKIDWKNYEPSRAKAKRIRREMHADSSLPAWARPSFRKQKPRYNQGAYLAGLGVNPSMRQNKGIYKPYANGGGVRKPKYNKKG